MLVLLHCFKMDKKLNTPGTKIGEFYGKSEGAKIQISVNSKNLKEAFQKLTDIFNESISKKNDMIKSLKDKLQEQYNEFDEKTGFYKMFRAEKKIRTWAEIFPNAYLMGIYACCR